MLYPSATAAHGYLAGEDCQRALDPGGQGEDQKVIERVPGLGPLVALPQLIGGDTPMLYPTPLSPGDRVALVGPSGPVPPERVQPAVDAVKALGLESL